ncbi:glycoside hydrolase family 5 protein [Armatimonas sp.]|uniref:glycoside hydrolase family 5 protein n=1 Tax=Armatimonas sp. TaxID=1872638 RepID=UPI003751A0C6
MNAPLEPIRLSKDGRHFAYERSGERFLAWGFNYDHDANGRLLEEYWEQEWPTVVADFQEMKALGANVVRVHFQVGRFLKSAHESDAKALKQLARLVTLAETTGLYLDITGLGCYHKKEVPAWYNALSESARWEAQAVFWAAIAKVCATSPAIFCYNLMNEPVVPGPGTKEKEWLVGEFGGKNFVQRIALDLAGRTEDDVARRWIETLVAAIRKHDPKRLITLGGIPWALVFPGAKPQFYTKEVGEKLDFVSVHFYPKKGEVEKALTALRTYALDKPLVIEEMFPLECSVAELDAFIEGSRRLADGWIGFYWGKTITELAREKKPSISSVITRRWLEYFKAKKLSRSL